jgi:hypothetical protein
MPRLILKKLRAIAVIDLLGGDRFAGFGIPCRRFSHL